MLIARLPVLPALLLPGLFLAACAQQAQSPAVPLATRPNVGQELGAVAENKVEIIFPAGGSRLTPDANRRLDLATQLFRDVHPVAMFTMGHTDASGNEFSNILLSAQRARAVKQGLIARGIPADRLRIQAFGNSEPANPANPLAADNRRVTIMWRLL